MLRTVQATRYVTPLREGGSLPALVEADDDGLYVVKFRGAGQGVLALAAELICGELARLLTLPVPELVFVEVDDELGRSEPDQEIHDLLRASMGINLALDYLPGSLMFDPAAGDRATAQLASEIVWFDALITNVDRTPRNPNLLVWHKSLHLIDHGAALYFHHNWNNLPQMARSRFPMIRDHVLLPWATEIETADERLRAKLTPANLTAILELVPDAWLPPESDAPGPSEKRAAYVDYLLARIASSSAFVEEAVRARGTLV